MTHYGKAFYDTRHEYTIYSARTILNIVRALLPRVDSAVDVGCGVGTWLSVLKDGGTAVIQGIDGHWVDKEQLQIPNECFLACDLNRPIDLGRRFDLAISLEVAEHLERKNAKGFVSSLAALSDFILFSAAIPGQGGVGHINEQWPNYWISHFGEEGFVGVDVVRKHVWNDEAIPLWYRQNTLLFVKRERTKDLKIGDPRDAVPGEVYLLTFRRAIAPSVRLAAFQLLDAVKRRLRLAGVSQKAAS
jgi:hypothetical protein